MSGAGRMVGSEFLLMGKREFSNGAAKHTGAPASRFTCAGTWADLGPMDREGIFSAVHGGKMFVLLILLILFNYLSIRGVPCVILDNLYLLTAAGLPLKLHSSFLLTPRILRAASTSHRKDHLACIFSL